MWEKKEVRASLQDGNRAWITLPACICADGSTLPPSLIYEVANKGIQSTWVDDIQAGEHPVFITSSPSGWTNTDIELAWLEQVFDRCTKEKARRSSRLLILDGHGSHITMDFINYCDQNNILLAILPPHPTHTLQPLHVAMVKPLSTAYSAELQKAETAELRNAAKLYKEKIKQEKRTARAEAKKVREEEKAEKAAERTRQKEAAKAVEALKSCEKGKGKASQPLLQSRKRQKRVVDALDTREALEGASAAPAISTRRGRSVKLPERFK